jgi:hypothetical protein
MVVVPLDRLASANERTMNARDQPIDLRQVVGRRSRVVLGHTEDL